MFREEGTQCRGKSLRRTVAAMKPEAQPLPRQDSRQAKAAVGCDLHRKAAWLRHLRTGVASARTPFQARSVPNHQGTLPAHWRGLDRLRCGWLWAWGTACRWAVVVHGDLSVSVGGQHAIAQPGAAKSVALRRPAHAAGCVLVKPDDRPTAREGRQTNAVRRAPLRAASTPG